MSKHVTMADWEKAISLDKAANPGDTVDFEIVDNFINSLPPVALSSTYVQAGEPASYVPDENGRWKPTFITFRRRDGVWTYLGECYYMGSEHKEFKYHG